MRNKFKLKTAHARGVGVVLIVSLLLLSTCGCTFITRELERPPIRTRIVFWHNEGAASTPAFVERILSHEPMLTWLHEETPKGAGWAWRGRRAPEKLGLVYVAVVQTSRALTPDSAAYQSLLQELAEAKEPWKIVLLERSIFFPETDRKHLALARLLERMSVALAISCDGEGYARSVAIGSAPERAVRHVRLGKTAAQNSPKASAVTIAFSAPGPCYAVMDVLPGEIVWAMHDANGKIIDTLVLRAGAAAPQYFSIPEIKEKERDARKKAREATPENAAP